MCCVSVCVCVYCCTAASPAAPTAKRQNAHTPASARYDPPRRATTASTVPRSLGGSRGIEQLDSATVQAAPATRHMLYLAAKLTPAERLIPRPRTRSAALTGLDADSWSTRGLYTALVVSNTCCFQTAKLTRQPTSSTTWSSDAPAMLQRSRCVAHGCQSGGKPNSSRLAAGHNVTPALLWGR